MRERNGGPVWALRIVIAACLLSCSARGADLSADLLTAAEKGRTSEVQALLGRGADVEARDKRGHTSLMLAAQHGRVKTVRLLLAKGAKPDVRDQFGLTAYGLTLLSPAGRRGHEEVLQALPRPARFRLAVYAAWTPVRLASSCFLGHGQLLTQIEALQLDALLLAEFAGYAGASGKGLVEMAASQRSGRSTPTPDGIPADVDAVLQLEVQPGAACVGQHGDQLTFSVGARLSRARRGELLLDKAFGGGWKGLEARTADNPSQYAPLYQEWIKPQAGPIYWAVVGALLKSAP